MPVERLLDSTSLLLRCVILGFTADGDHLVSYSFNDGRHELQVWAFRLHHPAVLLAAVPLFQNFSEGDLHASTDGAVGGASAGRGAVEGMTEHESEMLMGDFHGGGGHGHGHGHGEEMRISVCESANRDILIIHGEPSVAGVGVFGSSSEAPVARRCFITAVPLPATGGRGARRAPLGATHMSYLSTSATPFSPLVAGVIPAEEEVGSSDEEGEEEEEEDDDGGDRDGDRDSTGVNDAIDVPRDENKKNVEDDSEDDSEEENVNRRQRQRVANPRGDEGASGVPGDGSGGDDPERDENIDNNNNGDGGESAGAGAMKETKDAGRAREENNPLEAVQRIGREVRGRGRVRFHQSGGRRRVRRVNYLVVNSGDSLVGVRLTPSAAEADQPAQLQHGAAGPRLESLLSFSSGPTAPVRWLHSGGGESRFDNVAGSIPGGDGGGRASGREGGGERRRLSDDGEDDDDGERGGGSGGDGGGGGGGLRSRSSCPGGILRHSVVSIRAWTAMDTDAVLSRALAATLRLGYNIVDYELHVLGVAHGTGFTPTAPQPPLPPPLGHNNNHPSVIAVVVSVLQSRGVMMPHRQHQQQKQQEQQQRHGHHHLPHRRVVASVVECPLGRLPPPPPRLLYSVEVTQPPQQLAGGAARSHGDNRSQPHSRGGGGGGVVGRSVTPSATSRAVAWARARLAAFRRASHIPTNRMMRNAATLSNANVVASGESVSTIKHHTLPICILGYSHGRGGRG